MKRTLWSAVAAVLLAAVATMPVLAQPPQGRAARGFGPGRPGGPGPFPVLRELNLTDAQREQIRAIGQQARGGDRTQPRVGQLQRELQLAILADAPDLQRIDQLKGAIAAAMADELSARIDTETQVAQILTPEQRARARESLAKQGPPPNGPPNGGRRGRAGR